MAYTPHAVNLSRVEEIIDIIGIIGIKRIIVLKYDKGCNMHNVHNQYLIIHKCPMHIEITSVCGQDGEIEAFKSMTVKLEQIDDRETRNNVHNLHNSHNVHK
jgi:hypothetical protein